MANSMQISLDEQTSAALAEHAKSLGMSADDFVLALLRERLPQSDAVKAMHGEDAIKRLWPDFPPPRDEWEAGLYAIATDCGTSMTDEQLSREFIYED